MLLEIVKETIATSSTSWVFTTYDISVSYVVDGQPIAVLISNDQATSKSMLVGPEWAGREFSDYLGNSSQIVTIDDQGWGEFPVEEKSVSVWSAR